MALFFAASSSGFAESCARAKLNAWSKCQHTQQRIERGRPCPCGCKNKKQIALRLTGEHPDCETDDIVAHVPAFLQLVMRLAQNETPRPQHLIFPVIALIAPVRSLALPPPARPG